MHRTPVANTGNYQLRDIRPRTRSTTKQCYDGNKWQQTSTAYNCDKAAQVKGLYSQYHKELVEPPSFIHLEMDQFLLLEHSDAMFKKKRKHLEIENDSNSNDKIL